jgi:hypothetical protein
MRWPGQSQSSWLGGQRDSRPGFQAHHVTPSGPRNKQRRGPHRLPLPARRFPRDLLHPLPARWVPRSDSRAQRSRPEDASRPSDLLERARARIFGASELIHATSPRQVGEVNTLAILVNNKMLPVIASSERAERNVLWLHTTSVAGPANPSTSAGPAAKAYRGYSWQFTRPELVS